MRRKEQQLSEPQLVAVIEQAQVCRLALAAEPAPYIVPLSYGYRDNGLYFHSARQGRKIELLQQQPRVGFEISLDLGIAPGESACDWGVRFRSVIGHGRVEFVEELAAKREALDLIMAHYSPGTFSYPDSSIDATCVFRLQIETMTGKTSGV